MPGVWGIFFKGSNSYVHSSGLSAKKAKWYNKAKDRKGRYFHRGRRQERRDTSKIGMNL